MLRYTVRRLLQLVIALLVLSLLLFVWLRLAARWHGQRDVRRAVHSGAAR